MRRFAVDLLCDPIPYFVAVGFLLHWYGSLPPTE